MSVSRLRRRYVSYLRTYTNRFETHQRLGSNEPFSTFKVNCAKWHGHNAAAS